MSSNAFTILSALKWTSILFKRFVKHFVYQDNYTAPLAILGDHFNPPKFLPWQTPTQSHQASNVSRFLDAASSAKNFMASISSSSEAEDCCRRCVVSMVNTTVSACKWTWSSKWTYKTKIHLLVAYQFYCSRS